MWLRHLTRQPTISAGTRRARLRWRPCRALVRTNPPSRSPSTSRHRGAWLRPPAALARVGRARARQRTRAHLALAPTTEKRATPRSRRPRGTWAGRQARPAADALAARSPALARTTQSASHAIRPRCMHPRSHSATLRALHVGIFAPSMKAPLDQARAATALPHALCHEPRRVCPARF